ILVAGQVSRTMPPRPGFYNAQWALGSPEQTVPGRTAQRGVGGGVMVRGSGVDDPARSAAYADAPETGSGGGRWFVWTVRAVLWAVLLIIGYRGIMAIVLNETPASRSGTPTGTSTGGATSSFPVTLADAYALQFSSVFLNFSPATADQRARQLAAFVPSSISGAD